MYVEENKENGQILYTTMNKGSNTTSVKVLNSFTPLQTLKYLSIRLCNEQGNHKQKYISIIHAPFHS